MFWRLTPLKREEQELAPALPSSNGHCAFNASDESRRVPLCVYAPKDRTRPLLLRGKVC